MILGIGDRVVVVLLLAFERGLFSAVAEKGSWAVCGEAVTDEGKLVATVTGDGRMGGLPMETIAGSTKGCLGCLGAAETCGCAAGV